MDFGKFLNDAKKAAEDVAGNVGDFASSTAKNAGDAIKDAAENINSMGGETAKAAENIGSMAGETVKGAADSIGAMAGDVVDGAKEFIANRLPGENEEDRQDVELTDRQLAEHNKGMNFPNIESMQQVVNVINEASAALDDKNKTIRESAIPEVLAGALGAGVGGVGSFAALYGLGTVGLSAAGITSGLATAGAIVGGGMVAGVFVLAAPIVVLSGAGIAAAIHLKNKQLKEEKERLYKEALRKHEAIIQALQDEQDADKERLDYLGSLNILLQRAIIDLKSDLGETE